MCPCRTCLMVLLYHHVQPRSQSWIRRLWNRKSATPDLQTSVSQGEESLVDTLRRFSVYYLGSQTVNTSSNTDEVVDAIQVGRGSGGARERGGGSVLWGDTLGCSVATIQSPFFVCSTYPLQTMTSAGPSSGVVQLEVSSSGLTLYDPSKLWYKRRSFPAKSISYLAGRE